MELLNVKASGPQRGSAVMLSRERQMSHQLNMPAHWLTPVRGSPDRWNSSVKTHHYEKPHQGAHRMDMKTETKTDGQQRTQNKISQKHFLLNFNGTTIDSRKRLGVKMICKETQKSNLWS